jgi:Na+-driven multidrug efflux pump
MLTSGSYAFGGGNQKRLLRLFLWALLVSVTVLVAMTPIMVVRPQWIASIWITNDSDMEYAKKMLPIPFYANWLNAFNDATTNFLLTMKFAWTAMVPSLTRGAAYMAGATVLWATNKDDPVRMMWSFCINDFTVTVIDALILIVPLRRLISDLKGDQPKLMDT